MFKKGDYVKCPINGHKSIVLQTEEYQNGKSAVEIRNLFNGNRRWFWDYTVQRFNSIQLIIEENYV